MASSAGPGACYNLIPLPAALPAQSLDKKTLKLNKVVGQLNFRVFFFFCSLFFHYFTNPASSFSFTATPLSRLFHVLTSQLRGLIWSILCLHSLFCFSGAWPIFISAPQIFSVNMYLTF